MVTLNQIKSVNTLDELESLGIGKVYIDIGHRGGGIGFYSDDISKHFGVDVCYLPPKFGAGCNYLGGGVRGSIFASNFDEVIQGKKRELLEELGQACIRVYQYVENESGMNDDYEDEVNWDAKATQSARDNGIKSAY